MICWCATNLTAITCLSPSYAYAWGNVLNNGLMSVEDPFVNLVTYSIYNWNLPSHSYGTFVLTTTIPIEHTLNYQWSTGAILLKIMYKLSRNVTLWERVLARSQSLNIREINHCFIAWLKHLVTSLRIILFLIRILRYILYAQGGVFRMWYAKFVVFLE